MITPLFWTAAVLAVLDWTATRFGWKSVRLFTKPATLLALLIWFIQAGGLAGPLLWFGIGLVFSLTGDILLMLPARFFTSGLIAFLLAHVFYIFGFGLTPLPLHWGTIVALITIVAANVFLIRTIRKGMSGNPAAEKMLIPVQIYSAIISLMVFAAVLTLMRPEWPLQAALFASVGAVLFFISDSVLAYCRFCRPAYGNHVTVMITYHAAQFAITWGALTALG